MKNYIYTKSSTLVAFDAENHNDFATVSHVYSNTDYMYLISEDGVFHFDNETKYDVKKGDVVYIMYPINCSKKGYEREVIIVSDEKLYDYYSRYQAKENEDEYCPDSPCCCKCKCCNDCEPEQEEA